MRYFTLAAFILLFFTSVAQKKDTVIFSVVQSGNIKGFDKEWQDDDGTYNDWYQYNDRGRGDSMRTRFREDEQGFPTYIQGSGVDYYKSKVTEDFLLENGMASWRNNAEDEHKAVSGKVFYSGLKTSGGHMIKALKANNNKINLLPFGSIELSIVDKHIIETGANYKTVYLTETKGMGLTPRYGWIDDKDKDFAFLSEWQSSIIKGFEKYIPELLTIQKKYETDFYHKVAETAPQKMDGAYLIKDVNIFDAVNAKLLLHKDILISDGIIRKIAAANSIHTTAKTIDGKGKTAVPGMWDMHVHFTDDLSGILHMAAGVTHVRDMGNGPSLLDRIKNIESGNIIGPTVEIMSGFIDGAGPFAAPTGVLINNVEEGKKAIRDYASKGYQQIKLYSSIKPEWVKPLADETKLHHMRLAGHIPSYMTATTAINMGYNEVTHMNMVVLNFLGDTIDTRSTGRFTIPGLRAGSIDLNSGEMKSFIQLLKEKQITVDPTLVVFEDMYTNRDKITPEKYTRIINHFPLDWQRNIRAGGGGLPITGATDGPYKKSFDAFMKITKLLYDNKIKIVAGTDGVPGFDLHRELELYVKAGIPAEKVLQLATYGSAVYTGKSNKLGSINEGKIADIVLIEGNPIENISNIRKTKSVITQGKYFDVPKLYDQISIKGY